MRKTIFCLLIPILFSGCGIDYEGSTKYIFKGRITDLSGQPIPDIEVATFVTNGSAKDIIGYDHTDSNGNYTMIFPKARNVETSLYLNSEFYGNNSNPSYSGISINNISQEKIKDYTINFGSNILYRNQDVVAFHINLLNVSNIPLLKLKVTGLIQNNTIDYSLQSIEDSFNLGENYSYDYITTDYIVAKNQELMIKYLLADGSVHEINVPVGTENATINLEY